MPRRVPVSPLVKVEADGFVPLYAGRDLPSGRGARNGVASSFGSGARRASTIARRGTLARTDWYPFTPIRRRAGRSLRLRGRHLGDRTRAGRGRGGHRAGDAVELALAPVRRRLDHRHPAGVRRPPGVHAELFCYVLTCRVACAAARNCPQHTPDCPYEGECELRLGQGFPRH